MSKIWGQKAGKPRSLKSGGLEPNSLIEVNAYAVDSLPGNPGKRGSCLALCVLLHVY